MKKEGLQKRAEHSAEAISHLLKYLAIVKPGLVIQLVMDLQTSIQTKVGTLPTIQAKDTTSVSSEEDH